MLSTTSFLILAIIGMGGVGAGSLGAQRPPAAGPGPYFGQDPPGMIPEIFAPGIVSTAAFEGCILFSADGERAVFRRASRENLILEAEAGRDGWRTFRIPPMFSRLDVYSGDFTLGPDGTSFFFTSLRPVEEGQAPVRMTNLWVAKWQEDRWSSPTVFPEPVTTPGHQAYPTISADGTLYFFSRSPEEGNTNFLYRSMTEGGGYGEPERLPAPLNTGHNDFDPLVTADGNVLIFVSMRPGGYGGGDLYVSFKDRDGEWSEPVNMGRGVNSSADENRPFLTLDGRYFFFTSDRAAHDPSLDTLRPDLRPGNGSRDVYWVDAGIIDQLRPGG